MVVLAGLGSIPGTLAAAIIIGVAEAFVTAFLAILGAGRRSSRSCSARWRFGPTASSGRRDELAQLPSLALLIAAAGMALPRLLENPYYFFAGYVVLQYVVIATGWNILGGYAGYTNFGTSAFFGAGVYTAAFLIKAFEAPSCRPGPRGGRDRHVARTRHRLP